MIRLPSSPAVRLILALLAGLLPALAAAPAARAQDAGTSNFGDADINIWVQAEEGLNLKDFDLRRFFNKAHCDCDDDVWLYIQVTATGLQKRGKLTGNVAFFVGTDCDQPLLRPACQNLLNGGSTPVVALLNNGGQTIKTSARVLSTYTQTGAITTDGGTTTTGGTFTPTTTCTAPGDEFTQNIWMLADYGTGSFQKVKAQSVRINLTAPPAPSADNIALRPGNEALVMSWKGIDASTYPDLAGYQILCKRGADLQVFKEGSFTPGFQTCSKNNVKGPEGLDPLYVCSPLLSRLTESYRIKILQNGIPYGATVVSVDDSGNASAPDLFYDYPEPTDSFYAVYRNGDISSGGPGQGTTPGGAQGGMCTVVRETPRGLAALPVGAVLMGLMVLSRRRRRR